MTLFSSICLHFTLKKCCSCMSNFLANRCSLILFAAKLFILEDHVMASVFLRAHTHVVCCAKPLNCRLLKRYPYFILLHAFLQFLVCFWGKYYICIQVSMEIMIQNLVFFFIYIFHHRQLPMP